jgi:hypothetical protein
MPKGMAHSFNETDLDSNLTEAVKQIKTQKLFEYDKDYETADANTLMMALKKDQHSIY